MKDVEKLVYADGEKIGVFDGERCTLYDSACILRYREYAATRANRDEWKYGGEGARFRGDYDLYRSAREAVYASVNDVAFDGDDVLYAFTANESSGVCRKRLKSEKEPEDHVYGSSNEEIRTIDKAGNKLAVTVGTGPTSSIGILDLSTSELKTLTEGDSRDADPAFDGRGGILFDSAGAGRNARGEFVGKFAPAGILSLDLSSLRIDDVKTDEKRSYFKPRLSSEGELYCLRRPEKDKSEGNLFLDVVLFPFRILKAIFGFLQAFVTIFGKTSLTSASAGGDNPARDRKTDPRKLYVDGAYIEVEKELKRNRKKKEKDVGFIPRSWKFVRLKDGKEEILFSGACDYALCRDGGAYVTDGRHVFYLKDGQKKKIADAERCLALATEEIASAEEDPFSV